ncbi:MAG: hypothetical protein WAM91_00410 [Candidatus Acidiferrales bacterium]
MDDQSKSTEIASLRDECERLRKERDGFRDVLKEGQVQAEDLLSAKLKVLAQDLARQVQEEFVGRVKTLLWVAGLFIGIATLGGFFTIRDLAKQAIDDAIVKRESQFSQLANTELSDVVNLRTQTAMALDETRRLTDATKADVQRKAAEISQQTDQAKKLILETTKYWEATKKSVNRVKGIPPTQAENNEQDYSIKLINCLKSAGVHDADVDVFDAVIRNDMNGIKDGLSRGGNPNVSTVELMKRHRDIVAKSCPTLLR